MSRTFERTTQKLVLVHFDKKKEEAKKDAYFNHTLI